MNERVKRVARQAWTWTKAAPGKAKGWMAEVAADTAPYIVVCAGLFGHRLHYSEPGMKGADAIWWIGTGLIVFGLAAVYGRGRDRGLIEGRDQMARYARDGLVSIANRKIELSFNNQTDSPLRFDEPEKHIVN